MIEATRKLIERINNLNISNVCRENVLQVTSLIYSAVTRLGDNIQTEITKIILKLYQTLLYSKFNRLFEQMEVNMKITSIVYNIQEITSMANSNYQDLLDTNMIPTRRLPALGVAITIITVITITTGVAVRSKTIIIIMLITVNVTVIIPNTHLLNLVNRKKRKWKDITLYWCAK